jgi:glucose/arabinose dehydrogenase
MNAASKTCLFLLFSFVFLSSCNQRESFLLESEGKTLEVEVVTDSISVPFGMDFLPNGDLLVTDRAKGSMILVNVEKGTQKLIDGLPPIFASADGGMLDVIVHPDFENNHTIYYSYSIIREDSMSTMAVDRASSMGHKLLTVSEFF